MRKAVDVASRWRTDQLASANSPRIIATRWRRSGPPKPDATVQEANHFDRFNSVFGTEGAEKRKQHGSKGALVFRDPNQDDRLWVIFDWDPEGWKAFAGQGALPDSAVAVERESR